MAEYLERLVDKAAAELLSALPALLFVGPRACGKTTSAARLARTIVRLDRPADATAFRADPDAALRGLEEPVLLDEWQAVPEVLGAVKRAVDRDARAGRFVLTGSVRADLQAETWPGTGRLVRLQMGPMTVGERTARAPRPLVDRLVDGESLVPASGSCDLRDYVELALRSGFPEATLMANDAARERWLTSYVEQLITRDALEVEGSRDPARLRKYFEAYALNTAGIVEDRTLFEAAGVNRKTAAAYEQLLTNLLVVEALPAWSSNRLKRLTGRPKRHLVDVGMLTGAIGIDASAVMMSGEHLGRVLESFVVTHLRAEATVAKARPRLYHLRTEQGRQEIDVLAEIGAGQIVAFEVKATSSPDTSAARHLSWLRDALGERFLAGVVLHTGPRSFELGERITAAPISCLWA